ncbi:MAG: non-homologous end-joining DNA ligase [Candidatus Korobacteraceae bacterium]
MSSKTSMVEIEGKRLKLSNLDKVLYAEAGFTKAQVIDYYVRISHVLLPHLENRPLTMKRYPEGSGGMFFYEKNCPKHRPEWLQTAKVWSEGNQRWQDYCVICDVASLVWAANLACLELHTSLSVAQDQKRPTMLVFDLDPGAPADIVQCCQVGLRVRAIFERFRMQAFAKTSGSKGLQVYVPLNTPATYDQTKEFAHELARLLERETPAEVTSLMKKDLRHGKVFVDWSQNDEHKTTICVYSLRARERPTVSTPVTWQEVEECAKNKDAKLLVFEASQAIERADQMGDVYEPVLTLKQKLPTIAALQKAFARGEKPASPARRQIAASAVPAKGSAKSSAKSKKRR